MTLPDPSTLGAVYGLAELGLAIARRSGKSSVRKDRHSLGLLWLTILVSLACAFYVRGVAPAVDLPQAGAFYWLGLCLFVLGVALRWYSIFYLGRFFTVDVATTPDQQLVDSGPYRYLRHPSYAGALLAFVGLGFCLGNLASLVALNVPIFFAFRRRMLIEEDALRETLGDRYRVYCRRTKRLIPFLY